MFNRRYKMPAIPASDLQGLINWCSRGSVFVLAAQLTHFADNEAPEVPGMTEENFGGVLKYAPVRVHPFGFAAFDGSLGFNQNSNFLVQVSIGLTDPIGVYVRFVNGPENGNAVDTVDMDFLSGPTLGLTQDAVRLDFRGPKGKGPYPDYYYLALWPSLDLYQPLPYPVSVQAKMAHRKTKAKHAS
jgi:hypothetical protein